MVPAGRGYTGRHGAAGEEDDGSTTVTAPRIPRAESVALRLFIPAIHPAGRYGVQSMHGGSCMRAQTDVRGLSTFMRQTLEMVVAVTKRTDDLGRQARGRLVALERKRAAAVVAAKGRQRPGRVDI